MKMAKSFSARETPLATFDAADPNRKLALEESPWLNEAQGGKEAGTEYIDILDPKVAAAERASALAKLEKAQTSLGGFSWFPGGPPDPVHDPLHHVRASRARPSSTCRSRSRWSRGAGSTWPATFARTTSGT